MSTDAAAAPRAGMVGLGAMGRPIAQHMADAGLDVLTYDVRADATVPGAIAVRSLAEMAAVDVVIVIVPTDEDVKEVVGGADGLIAHGHPGLLVVISASVRPSTCAELATQGAAMGVDVIDAALTGGVRGAESGEINLLIGGDAAVVERASAVFDSFTKGYHVLGPVGSGQVAKSANNLIHWAQIVAIDESLRMAERLGVPAPKLRAALEQGPTDSRTLREMEQMRFTWYVKDIEIAQDLAAEVDMQLPVATLSRELMDDITVQSFRELLEESD